MNIQGLQTYLQNEWIRPTLWVYVTKDKNGERYYPSQSLGTVSCIDRDQAYGRLVRLTKGEKNED
jgi:hypothetical protein